MVAIEERNGNEQQQNHTKSQQGDGALVVDFVQIAVGPLVQLLQKLRLPLYLVTLQEHHVGIVVSDQCRLQLHFLCVRLALENVQSQFQQQIAARGIDVGGIEQRVANQLYAPLCTGESVDAIIAYVALGRCLFKHLSHTHGHAVVMCKHRICFKQVQVSVQCRFAGALFGPVALKGGRNGNARVPFQRIHKPVVPLNGRRRTFQPHHLNHMALPLQLHGNVFAHGAPHLVVVGTNVGGVFLRTGFAFEHNHGNTLVEGAVDGRTDGGQLVGSHNKQVYARLNQTVYLVNLHLVAVVGR